LNRLKYKGKDIFVVSVIGAQSSAKSTLLNYLFKCNFATSAGRCTKGVYFTIAECNGKIILVLDTEGLLSISARDHTFDAQITSFVMLVSDLVIFNNKGEVNTNLQNLLGVCLYAIDSLNKTQ
jgi:predicted GTPase